MFKLLGDSPVIKVNARYGAIAGALCIVFIVSSFYMGKHPFLISPFTDFRVFLFAVLLFFSLKEMRDYYLGGSMFFWQGTAGSLFFLASCSAVSAAGIFVFGAVKPQFLSSYVEQFTEQIRNLSTEGTEQIGKEVLEQSLRDLPSTTIGGLAGTYVWQSFVIGFFISVIISVILRQQPKT